jgi:hypothetical protein
MVHPNRPQMTILPMRFACWITKATDTHLEYVIPIAFPRQQWLRECTSMLRLYVHSLCRLTQVYDWYSTDPYHVAE